MLEHGRPSTSRWWALAALSIAVFMIMLDSTVVVVALPSIEQSLGVGLQELEWTVSAYVLAFAAFMLTGGRLADLLGRRRVFLAGLAVFTASSLACGLADDITTLVAARAVQGVGAALMVPASLSIVTTTFAEAERGLAIGVWTGGSALALAVGPLAGGAVVELIGWEWIFWLNVPVGVVGLLAGRAFIAESRGDTLDRSLDVPGLVVSAAALLALVVGLVEANERGWGAPLVAALLAAGLVGLAAFVIWERRARVPMLDLSLFRSARFAGANVVALLVSLAMFGVLFYVSLLVQEVAGRSPLEAGASFLPLTVPVAVVAPLAGKLADRTGPRLPTVVGMGLTGASLVALSRVGAEAGVADLAPGFVLAGLGIALTITPMTAAAMTAVPEAKAGIGSGVLNTARQVGGCLGIALMGAILAARSSAAVRSGAGPDAAFVDGLELALLVAAAFSFAGVAVAALTLGGREAPGRALVFDAKEA
jgi:EmrB/QacA subfamily drug resistance transporter